MHIMTLLFKNHPQPLQLTFNHFKDADSALRKLEKANTECFPPALILDDDHGSRIWVRIADLAGVNISDHDKNMELAEKNKLAEGRVTMKVNKKIMQENNLTQASPTAIIPSRAGVS